MIIRRRRAYDDKLKVRGSKTEISKLINAYGGNVMDFSSDFITAEIREAQKNRRLYRGGKTDGHTGVCRSGLFA
jgi:acetolactate synthase small subunit